MSATFTSVALVLTLLGQVPASDPAQATADREDRMRFFRENVSRFDLYRPEAQEPLPFHPEPVLRCSNPERATGSTDGATFLWLAGSRPVAVISLSIRRPNDNAYYECTSLWPAPLDCRRNGSSLWAPKTGGLLGQRMPDAPRPAESSAQRLTQMRAIARRFSPASYDPRTDQPEQLRLLTQPLYRFAAEEANVIDGAVFAYVVSNDPELLLMLEARRDSATGMSAWQFSLARMSSRKQVVRLDEKQVWEVPNFSRDPNEDRKTGPYVEKSLVKYRPLGAG